MNKKLVGLVIAVILLDQVVKKIVTSTMSLYDSISVIPNFFHLTYVQNIGAAFSILEGNRWFFILVATAVIGGLVYIIQKSKQAKKLELVSYYLLIGGIAGNLIDRLVHGYVIDYFDFNLFGYAFPVFNIADTAIVVAAGFIILEMIRGKKNETIQN